MKFHLNYFIWYDFWYNIYITIVYMSGLTMSLTSFLMYVLSDIFYNINITVFNYEIMHTVENYNMT